VTGSERGRGGWWCRYAPSRAVEASDLLVSLPGPWDLCPCQCLGSQSKIHNRCRTGNTAPDRRFQRQAGQPPPHRGNDGGDEGRLQA
jgi:hypothetical protein